MVVLKTIANLVLQNVDISYHIDRFTVKYVIILLRAVRNKTVPCLALDIK